MATRRTPLSPPPYATDRETLEREWWSRYSARAARRAAREPHRVRAAPLPSAFGRGGDRAGLALAARNRDIAFERLAERLVRLNHVPKKRVATRPTRASKERRLGGKKLRGVTKRGRGKVAGDE